MNKIKYYMVAFLMASFTLVYADTTPSEIKCPEGKTFDETTKVCVEKTEAPVK